MVYLIFSKVALKWQIFLLKFGHWGGDPQLTDGDSNTENSGHQRTCRGSVDFRGVLNEAREPLKDTTGGTNVIDPHKTASCKRDAPLFLQIYHLLRVKTVHSHRRHEPNLLCCQKFKIVEICDEDVPRSHHLQTSSKGGHVIKYCAISCLQIPFCYWL